MITRFFKTSKPLHYLFFLAVLTVLFIFLGIRTYMSNALPINFLEQIGTFFIFLMSSFVFVFVITKNDLTKKNSFAGFYLCMFAFLLPEVLSNFFIVLSNLFVLLSFRRIFSLKTNTNIKKKLFDSGFWIALACCFYPWAILYFLPLFFAIFLLPSDYFKHLCIVIFGVISVGFWVGFYYVLSDKCAELWLDFLPHTSLDFSNYNQPLIGIPAVFLAFLSLWCILSLFNYMFIKVSKLRFTFIMLFFAIIIGISIPLLSANKVVEDFLFLLFPLSIMMANYTERNSSQWMPNVFVLIALGLALTNLVFNIHDLLKF